MHRIFDLCPLFHDTVPCVVNMAQLAQGVTVIPYSFRGHYCGNNHLSSDGLIRVKVSDPGTLFLPNDTLTDVVRLTKTISGNLIVSKDRFPEMSENSDTIPPMQHNVTIDRWYSPNYKYEVAENVSEIYLIDGKIIKESHATYLCPPDEQRYALGKTETMNKSEHEHLHNDTHKYNLGGSSGNGSDGNVYVNYQGNIIDITVDVCDIMKGGNAISGFSGILCDLSGRVWRNFQSATHSHNVWNVKISVDGLPQGNYILSISVGKETVTHKLSL